MAKPPDDPHPEPGTVLSLPHGVPPRLGLYRLVRSLGAGGMGMVFEANQELLNQSAAVKVLLPRFAHDPAFVSRFRREMAALGLLKPHPNIVRAHYAGEEGGILYLAMDLVAGQPLSRLSERGPLPMLETCEIVRQAALGLEAIREAGLVHRDLKPSNLMLADDGTVKILDLGVARLHEPEDGSAELTSTGMHLGTFDYQAPEQAVDPRHVDIRADIYSLGCTFYRLLMGRSPYAEHASPVRKAFAHANQEFPALAPEFQAGLGAILARMVAKDPAQRYTTPLEVAHALQPFAQGARLTALLGHEAGSTAKDGVLPAGGASQPPTPTYRLPRRKWLLLAVGLALAVLAPFALIPLFGQPDDGAPEPNPDPGPKPGTPPAKRNPGLLPANDGVSPAGTPPRLLDKLAPGENHDLLAFPPVEGLWDQAGFRQYDSAKRRLVVNCPGVSLLHLGTLTRPSYSFSVSIHQSAWSSGTGVFLGHREAGDLPPKAVAKFQYFLFGQRAALGGATIPYLGRGSARVTIHQGKRMVGWHCYKEAILLDLRQNQTLTFTVVNHSLKSVSVAGVEYPRLADDEANKWFKPSDYQGKLGLVNLRNSSTYREALFQPR